MTISKNGTLENYQNKEKESKKIIYISLLGNVHMHRAMEHAHSSIVTKLTQVDFIYEHLSKFQ